MNPLVKYVIEIGSGMTVEAIDKTYLQGDKIDVTGEMASWEETELSMQRDGLTGVITEIATDIEFADTRVNSADVSGYVVLKRMFEKYGLKSKCKLRIYRRDNIDVDVYVLLHELDLNFQTYKWIDGKITIDGTSPTLQQYIMSQGKVKFDIPVSELNPEKFEYTPLQIESSATYEIPVEPNIDLEKEGAAGFVYLDITHLGTETVDDKSLVLSKSQATKAVEESDFDRNNFFLEAVDRLSINLNASFGVEVNLTDKDGYGVIDEEAIMYVWLMVSTGYGQLSSLRLYRPNNTSKYSGQFSYNKKIPIEKGERLYLVIAYENVRNDGAKRINIKITNPNLHVSWVQTSRTVSYIDVIEPSVLLQAVLDKMSSNKKFTGVLKNFTERYYTSMLCAAESIRGFKNAQIHVSFDDIIKWLEVKGYTYIIDGNTIIFDNMYNFFDKGTTAVKLGKSDITSDVQIEAMDDYSYTSVKVGYKKYEYNNINGRYEANGTFEYKTGHVNDKDKVLELISPFRADNYGIEFLTWERWNTEDDKADNDIFEVAAIFNQNTGFYEFAKSQFYSTGFGVESGINFYNAELSPYELIRKNERRIGIITDQLEFASTTNNRDVYIDGYENPFGTIYITRKLFSPFLYKLTVGISDVPPKGSLNGIVTFPVIDEQGEYVTKRGFIKEAYKSMPKEKAQEWVLLAE